MRSTCIFIALFTKFVFSYSQTQLIDSLKRLTKREADTSNIKILNRLALKLAEENPEQDLKYLSIILKQSQQLNFHKGLAQAYNVKGICFDVTSKYDSAIACYKESIKISSANNFLLTRASALNNLGLIYWNIGNYKLANASYFEALKHFEFLKDKNGEAKCNSNIGLIYFDLQDYNAAVKFYRKALSIYQAQKNEQGKANVYTNLGTAYSELQNLSLAENYIDSSIILKRKINDRYGLGISLVLRSDILIDNKEFIKAEHLLNEAETIFTNIGEINRLITVYNAFVTLNDYKKEYKLVEVYANKMLDLAQQIKSLRKQRTALVILSKNYFEMGEYKNAYLFEQKAKIFRDSIINIESIENINELKEKYESEKKDLTIANNELVIGREQKNNFIKTIIIISLVIVTMLVIILLLIYFRNKRLKQQNQNEQKASLIILDTEQKERVRIARELHDSIGQKLTVLKMFSSANTETEVTYTKLLDDTITEVRTLSHNMIPEILNLGLIPALKDLVQKLNLSEQIKCELLISNSDEFQFKKEIELSIYRIVQEVLNNMLKHAKASILTISVSKSLICISDNGIGFDVKSIQKSKGIGWQNIFMRAKLINATVEVKSSEKGTIIKLILVN